MCPCSLTPSPFLVSWWPCSRADGTREPLGQQSWVPHPSATGWIQRGAPGGSLYLWQAQHNVEPPGDAHPSPRHRSLPWFPQAQPVPDVEGAVPGRCQDHGIGSHPPLAAPIPVACTCRAPALREVLPCASHGSAGNRGLALSLWRMMSGLATSWEDERKAAGSPSLGARVWGEREAAMCTTQVGRGWDVGCGVWGVGYSSPWPGPWL